MEAALAFGNAKSVRAIEDISIKAIAEDIVLFRRVCIFPILLILIVIITLLENAI